MKRVLLLFAFILPMAVSCRIDKAYDLEKPVDTHFVVARELALPIGDLGSIPTSALMILLGIDYISFDEDGNVVLDFTDNPELAFQYDITGLNFNNFYDMKSPFGLVIDMDIINTSPFSFTAEAALIDSLGTVVDEYHPIIKGGVDSGAPGRPTLSGLSLSARVEDIVPFDGIRLSFRFNGGDYIGRKYVVGKDENLGINSLGLSFPEGIPFDPEWVPIISPIVKFIKLFNIKSDKKKEG